VAYVWVATGSFGGDEFADGGGDLGGEAPDEVGGLGHQEVAAHAVGEGEFGELFDPDTGWSVQEAAAGVGELAGDVIEAAYRPGGSAGGGGRLVNDPVPGGPVLRGYAG
jgi:hypothetical protein